MAQVPIGSAERRAGPGDVDAATERELTTIARGLEIVAARSLADAEDARDAVQETLARAVAAMRRSAIPAGVALGAFVLGIARHVIADVQRARSREARRAGLDVASLPASEPSALERLVREEERASVRRALECLGAADRQLLQCCYVDGMRLVDIAAASGEPVERVRKRKSRALGRLREILAEDPAAGGHGRRTRPTIET